MACDHPLEHVSAVGSLNGPGIDAGIGNGIQQGLGPQVGGIPVGVSAESGHPDPEDVDVSHLRPRMVGTCSR